MGLLSDVFVASRADAQALDPNWGPTGSPDAAGPALQLPTFQAKWLDPVKLGTLEEIITGTPYDEIADDLTTEDVAVSDQGEAGIFGVRPSLTAALAGLADADIPTAAARWAATEEWRGASGPDLEPLIRGMVEMALLARGDGKALWIWWSL